MMGMIKQSLGQLTMAVLGSGAEVEPSSNDPSHHNQSDPQKPTFQAKTINPQNPTSGSEKTQNPFARDFCSFYSSKDDREEESRAIKSEEARKAGCGDEHDEGLKKIGLCDVPGPLPDHLELEILMRDVNPLDDFFTEDEDED